MPCEVAELAAHEPAPPTCADELALSAELFAERDRLFRPLQHQFGA